MDSQKRQTESVRVLVTLFGDTNADLADVLRQSTSSVSKKRTGAVPWTHEDIERLAARFGVSVEQIEAGPRAWLGLPEADAA